MEPEYIRLKDIKPVLAGYLSDAMGHLKQAPVPDDASVHEMRVLLKKARSVLRLINAQVNAEFRDKDIASLKEAASLMSDWRDSSVLRKCLKELRKDNDELFERLSGNERISSLLLKPQAETTPSPDTAEKIARIEDLLKKTAYRVRFHNLQDLDANELLKAVNETYERAVSGFVECRNKPSGKKLHSLRKRIKDLLYQIYFFRPVNPSVVRGFEKKLTSVTRNLGKYNDLEQLLNTLQYEPGKDSAMDELMVRIRERQERYLLKALASASVLLLPGKRLASLLGYKILVL